MPWVVRSNDGSYFDINDGVLIDVPQDQYELAIETDSLDELYEELSEDSPELSDLLADYIKSEGG